MPLVLKQVDAYYMFDGRDKDNASEGYPYHEDGFITADDADSVYKFVNRASEEKYQVSRRFGNREPRFYASISFNGCVWESENAYKNQNGTVDIQNKPCNYYRGGENGKTSSEPEFCLLRESVCLNIIIRMIPGRLPGLSIRLIKWSRPFAMLMYCYGMPKL